MTTELPKNLINPQTGSVFPIIATNEHLAIGIRFGVNPASEGGTVVYFRIRVEERPDGVVALMSLHNYVKELWPDVSWTGHSYAHVSILGRIKVPAYVGDLARIMEILENNKVPENTYRLIQEKLPGIQMSITEDEFKALVEEEVSKAVSAAYGDPTKSACVYSFSGKVVH